MGIIYDGVNKNKLEIMVSLVQQINDLGVIPVAPTSPGDLRVPLAEESALSDEIDLVLYRQLREGVQGWAAVPTFSIISPLTISVSGTALSAIYPIPVNVATQMTVPALSSTSSTINQNQYLQLVCFAAKIGVSQDPSLAITFNYQDPTTSAVASVTKENAKRARAYWLLVLSPDKLTPSTFNAALSSGTLTIANTSDAGFSQGVLQIYGKDPNLVTGASYPVYTAVTDVIPLLQVKRLQNTTDQGYTWGYSGEEALTTTYHVTFVGKQVGITPSQSLRTRLIQIMTGKPGAGSTYIPTIRNLTASSVSIRPERPGVASDAPNGTINLSNSQRITFTNQGFLSKYGVQIITAGNDGSGNALLSAIATTSGTTFSELSSDHKIYSSAGIDETLNGKFLNLGGVGSLTWIAGANSSIVPGVTAYFVPAIKYPAGSGFSVPFEAIERAWNGVTEISSANILTPDLDLSAYAAPANNENYFLVTGSERAAIHYILSNISVTSNSSGIVTIPNNTYGNFAFIQGVTGRIDAPVYTGLAPNTVYNALQYYAPKTTEQWQFQMRVSQYQGLGNSQASWLDGATISSSPIVYFHTKGGGESCFQGDATFRYVPVSMHLPIGNSTSYPYDWNYSVQLINELYSASNALREFTPSPASGLALPTPGQILTFTSNYSVAQRSISGAITSNGKGIGFKLPSLQGNKAAQAVIGFLVNKGIETRLLIATYNGMGATDISIDSSTGTGFDTFRI